MSLVTAMIFASARTIGHSQLMSAHRAVPYANVGGKVSKMRRSSPQATRAFRIFIVSNVQVLTLLLYDCLKDDFISTLAGTLSVNVTFSYRLTHSRRSG